MLRKPISLIFESLYHIMQLLHERCFYPLHIVCIHCTVTVIETVHFVKINADDDDDTTSVATMQLPHPRW